MILAVGNLKGGVGKTTRAVNLAIVRAQAGRDVLLMDGDEQCTALTCTALQTEHLGTPGYTAVSLQEAALRTNVRQLASTYDDIIVDVGGRDSGSLRAAFTVAQTLLIPEHSRSVDLWAVDHMATLVKEAREMNSALCATMVLNAADTHGRDNDEAAAALREVEGLARLLVLLRRRKAFPNAAASGRAVIEQTPKDVKAVSEFQALMDAFYNSLNESGTIDNGHHKETTEQTLGYGLSSAR